VQAQPVDVSVARLEVVARQILEALVGRPEHVHAAQLILSP
jgi:hypothetical protein